MKIHKQTIAIILIPILVGIALFPAVWSMPPPNPLDQVLQKLDQILSIVTGTEDKMANIRNSQFVPFKEEVGPQQCASIGQDDQDQLVIDSQATTGNFVVSSIFLVKVAYYASMSAHFSVDGQDLIFPSGELAGQYSSVDLMGTDLSQGLTEGGKFLPQLTASSNGDSDVVVTFHCIVQPGVPNLPLDIVKIIVSGWKQADDTITVIYVE